MSRYLAWITTLALVISAAAANAESSRVRSQKVAEQAAERGFYALPDLFDGLRAERRAKSYGMGHDIVVTQRLNDGRRVKRVYAEKKSGPVHYRTEIWAPEPNGALERVVTRDGFTQHIRRGRRVYTFEHGRRKDGTFTPRQLISLDVEKRGGLVTRHYDFKEGLVYSRWSSGYSAAPVRSIPAMKRLKLRLRSLVRRPVKP